MKRPRKLTPENRVKALAFVRECNDGKIDDFNVKARGELRMALRSHIRHLYGATDTEADTIIDEATG
jgi:hypothetical protein